MKKSLFLLFILACFQFADAQDKSKFNTYWDNGLQIDSDDGDFKIKMGGQFQYDIMFIIQDDSLNAHYTAENGAEFRRARLYTSGTLFGNVKFKFQVDFAPAKVVLKDVYLTITKIPFVGNFQAGNFKQPFGMEMLTSSNTITEMERPLTNQFDHDRDLGIMLFNDYLDGRIAWQAGYFVPSNNMGKYTGEKYQLTGRVSTLPFYYTDNGYKVLHIDLAYSYHFDNQEESAITVKPEAHLAPSYLKISVDALQDQHQVNGGLALILGPLAFQGAYTFAIMNPANISTLKERQYYFNAYFTTISWFITGEHKNFSKSKTSLDLVKPKKKLGKGGAGAFELAFRYSSIDFNDADLHAGSLNDITVGLNWYVNPAVRYTLNYINANVKELGRANIFQMRFQVAF